ncbi:MAG: GNAT family N-acetyltransferase [Candidatus Melainabacteria bacterium]|nr:GNAT family N-acetyltransferase [Candidatus Melainabacteria bacterium]
MIEFDISASKFLLKSESQFSEPDRSASQQTLLELVHRPIEDTDVEQVLALQNRAFGTKRTQEDWRWKCVDNPHLQNAGVVGVIGDRIVSSYTIVGLKLNVLGSPILVGQSTDTVIDADFRGQGYFQILFDYAMRYGQRLGSQAALGFPNHRALRTNLHQAQLNPIVVLKAFSQRLCFPHNSISQSLKTALLGFVFKAWIQSRLAVRLYLLRIAVGSMVKIEKSWSIPESFEDLWNTVRKREIVSFWKDTEYMKWRYEKNPNRKAEYFLATKDGILCGLAAFVRRGDVIYITELMLRNLDVDLGKLLVYSILQDSLNSGVEVVKFYGHDKGFFELVFSDFMRQPAEDIVFIANIYDDLLRELCKQPLNLCITTGDTDASW